MVFSGLAGSGIGDQLGEGGSEQTEVRTHLQCSVSCFPACWDAQDEGKPWLEEEGAGSRWGYPTVGILHAAVAGERAQWDAAVSADTETLTPSAGQVLFSTSRGSFWLPD